MEDEKQKINRELHELDEEEFEIKDKSESVSIYERRQKIYRDQEARKNAEKFIKEIREDKRYREHQKQLQLRKSQFKVRVDKEEKKKVEEEGQVRQKQEKREAILRRMEEEERRKVERQIMDNESNKLIQKLKKKEEVEHFAIEGPSRLIDYRNRKHLLEQRKILNIEDIEQHSRRYSELRREKHHQRESKLELTKAALSPSLRYPKNSWRKILEEEESERKKDRVYRVEARRNNLEKQIEYSSTVKNKLPGIRLAHNESLNEDEITRRMKEFSLRRETSERLKQLNRKKVEVMAKPEYTQRYKNYLGRIKKKQPKEESDKDSEVLVVVDDRLEQVLSNASFSDEQKFRILKKKAAELDLEAKEREKDYDEEVAGLYIDSINTKLALLKDF